MELDFESNPIGAIFGIIFFLIFGIVILNIFTALTDQLNKDQCSSYIETIDNQDQDLLNLHSQITQTNNLLNECNNEYSDLLNEKISKQDFEEIKGYYNLTQIQINNLYQKFDQVTESYQETRNTIINKYNFHFTLNFLLAIELLSFLILKNEFVFVLLKWLKKRSKKK